MKTITLVFALLLCLFSSDLFTQNVASIKLSEASYNEDLTELSIDIEIKADDSEFILADQYYRFYYDSEIMKINESSLVSHLPSTLYYDAELIENIEGFNASHIGSLSYDDNLGFVNLYIELSDVRRGGTKINSQDNWIKVVTLTFDIINTEVPAQATWAREAKTGDYASAYALVSEWVNDTQLDIVDVNEYEDLVSYSKISETLKDVEVVVGPNPTSGYLKVSNRSMFNISTSLTIRDFNGRAIITKDVSNEYETTLNLDNVSSGNYFVEISNLENNMLHVEKIILAK